MLLPPSEWLLKTSAQRILAYVHPSTPTNAPKDLRGYWTKVHKMFKMCRKFIGGLGMGIGFAIFPTVVEFQRSEWRRVCQFLPTRERNGLP